MCLNSSDFPSSRRDLKGPLCARSSKLLILMFAVLPAGLVGHAAPLTPLGTAWRVRGVWHTEFNQSEAIRAGDAIVPGSLLHPEPSASEHSITILLPDGQSILYECFTTKDCERGFRVPELELTPTPFAMELISRIRGVLLRQGSEEPDRNGTTHAQAGQDETAAVIGPGNRIEVSGLAASLSDGKYVYDLNPFHSAYLPQSNIAVQKSGRSIWLQVPGPGIYNVRILDSLNNPRIDYLVAAVVPDDRGNVMEKFHKAQAQFKEWKKDFLGWPTHEFLRAYLKGLMFKTPPAAQVQRVSASRTSRRDVTAEPIFSPKPGISDGDMEVSLSCPDSRAVIHYTIDGSQPFDSSPVYHAPIIMKGLTLRLKAFAELPGKKDSPVVMGLFRVKNRD